jgi:hypothetical protein
MEPGGHGDTATIARKNPGLHWPLDLTTEGRGKRGGGGGER